MRLQELIEMWRRIFSIAEKPESKEYLLLLRIILSGLLLVGIVGFLIHLAFYFIQGGHGG